MVYLSNFYIIFVFIRGTIMKDNLKEHRRKIFIIMLIFILIIFLIVVFTYALKPELLTNQIASKIIRIDEEVYGETTFDSSNLDFRPILDNWGEDSQNNIIYISFVVGGNINNNIDHIVYDIALADLRLDCSLVSPYLKWKLLKNGELLSSGSLDYHFDTIREGRLILTPIQQDLKDYSEDKNTYDCYDFYMWLSDSCQNDQLDACLNSEDQSDLSGKKISGKIEVELYADTKKELIRTPSDQFSTDYCEVGSGDAIYVDG